MTHLQLHPGTGYSEFIAGLQLGEDGRTEFREGILLELARTMREEEPGELAQLPHVLILDEVNRTDLSVMLGEAFSAIEADKRGISMTLPATDKDGDNLALVVPDELYIIGTMNEIDHSVESLDFALRRRFLWFDSSFDADGLRSIWQYEWERVRRGSRVTKQRSNSNTSLAISNRSMPELLPRLIWATHTKSATHSSRSWRS
ncbi:MAG: AAA family ATPase [Micrococcaceae bacterium]|nr:AAA family ATPase [Micrococcaceae bacterium]